MVGHRTRLEGLNLPGLGAPDGRPRVVSILEQDFVTWLLDRLSSETGRAELADRDAFARKSETGVARFWQPVHRAYNVVLVDVACEVEGLPRLDPNKVLEAGVVVRRRNGSARQGWMHADGNVLGWRPLPPDAVAEAPIWHPDPASRKQAAEGLNTRVLRQAALPSTETASFEEAFAPLYPAPPKLCKTLGRTLFFGYLPLTSNERSETDPAPEAPFDDDDIRERLPSFLWRDGRREDLPSEERPAFPLADTEVSPTEAANPRDSLAVIIAGVTYLAQEAGLFTPQETADGVDPTTDLRALLQSFQVRIMVPNGTKGTQSFGIASTSSNPADGIRSLGIGAGGGADNVALYTNLYSVLVSCYDFLIRRLDDTETVRLPVAWPVFDKADENRFVEAVLTAVQARWARLSPGETRYQDLAADYELRAFARIDRSEHGCPPETVWTPPSQPFEIAPWYESGEAPPAVVELPSPTQGFMEKLKPNIAFKVPEDIQQFMSGLKLDELTEGKKPGPRLGFGMICGFSIPILTICAFIVLQIFLVLFHILFWWLPFIRICIPFPKPK